ncbi:MAG: polyphosphate kinase, partial [Acidiferrobacteraceae bacterium]
MDGIDFKKPELYSNRELSLLAFHRRVLDLATDDAVPLLERLRFLCISSTNLDEFFEIRVAGIKEQVAFGSGQPGPDNLSPLETLAQIRRAAHELVEDQYRILNEVLIPALATQNIRFVRRTQWGDRQAEWVRRYFNSDLLPVLSPLGLDPAHPFPRVLNKSLNFIVSLEGRDAFGRAGSVAVVQAPRSLPRLIPLPPEYAQGPHDFVLLSSIIHAQVNALFPGMKVTGCYQFRATRNSDLFVDEEEIDDLLRAVEGELLTRHYGDAVRLEVADNCPADMADFLLQQFKLDQDDLYRVNGLVNLNRLLAICDLPDRADLRYPPFSPAPLTQGAHGTDLFELIRVRDIVLHHPYQSFAPILEFVRQAAAD